MHTSMFSQAQGKLKRMLEGAPPPESNEFVDICIPDVWTPDGKGAKPVSIYCTVQLNRTHVVTSSKPKPLIGADGKPERDRGQILYERDEYDDIVYESHYAKGVRYGFVVNFNGNFRYHDGDDSKYAARDDEGTVVRDGVGNLVRAQTFHPQHCYPGFGDKGSDISKLSWPPDVSEAKRAEFHRETFYNYASLMLMGANGRGRLLNAAFRIQPPAPAAHVEPEPVKAPRK